MSDRVFEIGVVGQFEAAHRLRGDLGAASRTHGHTYRVEVIVRGSGLGEDGTLCDIGVLRGALDEVLAKVHYRDLDETDLLRGRNTTAEVVAEVICDQLKEEIGNLGLDSVLVRVWESPQAFASCETHM